MCISYILLIKNQQGRKVRVGRLGVTELKPGWYTYIGSAEKNLLPRVKRHLSKDKKIFWHIDYFLKEPGVSVKKVWLSTVAECTIAKIASVCGEPIRSFGSSDCNCGSHLFYLGV